MTELMASGIELMIVGMGIVFLFLAMLVVAINTMTYIIQRFFPEVPAIPSTQVGASGIDKPTVAAITAAVHLYRKTQR
jgi:oxaloacetate decarboxylase gamma subunit